jgi:hypothetical protein
MAVSGNLSVDATRAGVRDTARVTVTVNARDWPTWLLPKDSIGHGILISDSLIAEPGHLAATSLLPFPVPPDIDTIVAGPNARWIYLPQPILPPRITIMLSDGFKPTSVFYQKQGGGPHSPNPQEKPEYQHQNSGLFCIGGELNRVAQRALVHEGWFTPPNPAPGDIWVPDPYLTHAMVFQIDAARLQPEQDIEKFVRFQSDPGSTRQAFNAVYQAARDRLAASPFQVDHATTGNGGVFPPPMLSPCFLRPWHF